MREHLEPAAVTRLLAGELEEPEADACLRHLAECGECLEVAEELWDGIPALVGEAVEVPSMTRQNARKIERRLFRRMHVASAGTQLTWMATSGFVRVIVVLLRPILARTRHLDS